MNNNMLVSRNNALKSKVVIGFILVLSALGGASYISYQSFEELTRAVNTISSTDPTLEQIDRMLVTITQTENALQEYTIAKSPEKLTAYGEHIEEIKKNANLLKKKSSSTGGRVDSILNLIDDKLVNMESFMTISKQRDEFDFYNKALKELEEGQKQISASDSIHFLEETRRNRTSMLSLLRVKDWFDKRNESPSANEVAEMPADSVKKILRLVRNQQNARQRKLDDRELAYLETNDQVMGSIHMLLDQLKRNQQASYRARSDRAKASMEDALVRIGFVLLIALFSSILIVYLILADITRSDFYKRKLIAAKSGAEKLARVKEDFLANMSHEIRTPLTAILGFAEQLRFTALDHRQQDYLQALDASSQHLLALVNDVLDFSKIEAGGLSLERVPFHVLEAVEEVQYALQPQAEKKGLYLRVEADEEQSYYVAGDAFRLKQVLYNLLSNAIKFTHEGGITVAVAFAPHATGEAKVSIAVQDTGIGIAPDQLSSVFQAFSQSDASTTRKYGGTGLGLSICKKLVEMQGGTIKVESVANEGSTFRIALPYLVAEEPVSEPEEVLTSEISFFYQGTALVIDDQPLNSQLLELSLKSRGMRTVSAISGKEGLALLRQQSFDIIFCDLHMPEMDGKQVIGAMMQNPAVTDQQIPVVAFTANVLPPEQEQYRALGVCDFLFKPFGHRDLDRLLMTHLPAAGTDQGKRITSPTPSEATPSEATPSEATPSKATPSRATPSEKVIALPDATYTLEAVKQFTGDDDELLVDYLQNFISSYAASVGYLQQALDESSAAELSFYAHKMVSHAELLRHTELTATLKQLEQLSERDPITDWVSKQVERAICLTEQLLTSMRMEIDYLEQKVA